jgi:ornithine carbamoyltransferase
VRLTPFGCMFSACPRHHCVPIFLTQIRASLQRAGRNVDFDTYLLPPGSADVFFASDFPNLMNLWHATRSQTHNAKHQRDAAATRADVVPTGVFMNMYADVKRTKTMAAFNPLLDDFNNTAFMLADCT